VELSDPAQVRAVIEREHDPGWEPGVVVFDTYSHAFGAHDAAYGNENERAILFARVVRHIMRKTGATVVVVDHTGFEIRDDPRGASAKRQQADVAILMTSRGAWLPGQPSGFRLENKKAARFGNPFDVTGRVVDEEGGGLDVVLDPPYTADVLFEEVGT
jgi:hypothetical protein